MAPPPRRAAAVAAYQPAVPAAVEAAGGLGAGAARFHIASI